MTPVRCNGGVMLRRSRWSMILPCLLSILWLGAASLLVFSEDHKLTGLVDVLFGVGLLGIFLIVGGMLFVFSAVRWLGIRYGAVMIMRGGVAWRVWGGWKVVPRRFVQRIGLVEKLVSYDWVIRLSDGGEDSFRIVLRSIKVPSPASEFVAHIPIRWHGKVRYGDPVD